jgi:DNA-binding MarR family transcriptional regulator
MITGKCGDHTARTGGEEMDMEYLEIFEAFCKFRKLHLSSVLPNITHGEYATMKTVSCMKRKSHAGDGVSVSVVAKEMMIPCAGVSRSVRQLEEKGYMERSVNLKDRRNTYISLTEKGEQVTEEADQIMCSLAEAVMNKMGQEELHQLKENLEKLYEVTQYEITLIKNSRQ